VLLILGGAGPELMEDDTSCLALGAVAIAAGFITRRRWR
jgi:hypothetical protein